MTHSRLPRVRRTSQVLFLAAFLFLLFRTEFSGSFKGSSGDVRLAWPVSIFLEADPLAALTTAISTGTLYRGLFGAWSSSFRRSSSAGSSAAGSVRSAR